jgi:hypothetical protein
MMFCMLNIHIAIPVARPLFNDLIGIECRVVPDLFS